MRRNLFIGIPNDKLKECYESYKRVQCKREHETELFSELSLEYINIVGEKAAIAICQADMFNEIATRWIKIMDGMELSEEETDTLRYILFHPDKEALEKRDKFLASVNQTIIKNDDESFTIDCPDLDLSNIEELSQQS